MGISVDDLKRQILFEGIEDDELEKVSKLLEVKKFAKGVPVFKEKYPTAGIYMISSGEVELKKSLKLDTKTKMLIMIRNISSSEIRHSSHGWEHIFAKPKEGDFFGELSVIEGKERHGADAVAIEDTELFLFRTEKFNELAKTDPLIMAKMMRTITKAASGTLRRLDRRLITALTS